MMKKEVKNAVTLNSKKSKLAKVGEFLNKHAGTIACMMLVALMATGVVSAGGNQTVTADSLWTTVIDLVQKWVTRLGAVVMIIGGVMFGLGWQREDASAKSNGITTLIAGGIVIAVVNLIGSFAK